MKSKIDYLVIICVFSGFAVGAHAKSKKDHNQEVAPSATIALPGNHLIMTTEPKKIEGTSWLGGGLNSYAPGNFSLPSRFSNASNFSRGTPVGLYLNYSRPVYERDFNLKIGAGWIGLKRTATLSGSGTSSLEEQDLNLASLRLGVEYAPEKWSGKTFAPYASASLLPSFAMSGQSAFDEGTTYFGVPLEVAIGTRIKCNSVGIPIENADFDISASAVAGSMKGSSMNGLGIGAGMRVSL